MRLWSACSVAVAALVLSQGRAALAQFPTGRVPTNPNAMVEAGANGTLTPLQIATNPYLSPSVNPFLGQHGGAANPLSPSNAALYYWMAQQQSGGLGSGQLSGTRGNPAMRPGMPRPAIGGYATFRPGASASGYFMSGWNSEGGLGQYYNRTGKRYLNNRR